MFLGGTYRRLETEVHKAKYGNRLSRSIPHHFSSVFAYGASRSHRSCYKFSTILANRDEVSTVLANHDEVSTVLANHDEVSTELSNHDGVSTVLANRVTIK
ncbi:hypothetical protein J6590_004683 [Homalodisca vitripennis]|nr:hypothetical protein J6590_004683 [Homalodisca vitripennis]